MPNFRPRLWIYLPMAAIPSGNFVVSTAQRPYSSTLTRGSRYQKSSRLTYLKPCDCKLLCMASACASKLLSVGFLRIKLQVLHPICGFNATPLSSALAVLIKLTAATHPAATMPILSALAPRDDFLRLYIIGLFSFVIEKCECREREMGRDLKREK